MSAQDSPYRQIANDIRRRIGSGELRPGDLVPSARQITREWGVAIATATKALAVLRQAGLTTVRPGVGTVVAGRGRGPAPRDELTRDRIVAAAIAIADAEGFASVSMRRLAGELGVATMSLYGHLPGKDELTLYMIDAVFGANPLPDKAPRGWRARLELGARQLWRMFREHPWLAPAMSVTRPQPAVNGLRYTEWVLATFEGTRLSMQERLSVHLLLFTYIRGLATTLEPEAQAQRDTGMTGNEWMDTGFTGTPIPAAEFPMFGRLIAADDFDFDLEALFDFGLARLLDGLAAYVSRR